MQGLVHEQNGSENFFQVLSRSQITLYLDRILKKYCVTKRLIKATLNP